MWKILDCGQISIVDFQKAMAWCKTFLEYQRMFFCARRRICQQPLLIARSCVPDTYKPRQVRKEAAVVTSSGVAANLAISSGCWVTLTVLTTKGHLY
jgi:hypothetical protein